MTDPLYASVLEKVWLWEEFLAREELGAHDFRIDLVAKTRQNGYWAIQCKLHDRRIHMAKGQVDSVINSTGRIFTDSANGQLQDAGSPFLKACEKMRKKQYRTKKYLLRRFALKLFSNL